MSDARQRYRDLVAAFEPLAAHDTPLAAQASLAISAKRIADALDRLTTLAEVIAAQNPATLCEGEHALAEAGLPDGLAEGMFPTFNGNVDIPNGTPVPPLFPVRSDPERSA